MAQQDERTSPRGKYGQMPVPTRDQLSVDTLIVHFDFLCL